MRRFIRCIAEDHTGRWQIGFEPEEPHLYIEFSPADDQLGPSLEFTVEDFLISLPRNELQRAAHKRFVEFVERVLRGRDTHPMFSGR